MFRAALSKIVQDCDGALSAVLMGFDGIAVDTHTTGQGDVDMESVTAELCAVLGQVRRAGDILKVGALEEVAIRSERLTFLLRVLTNDYYLGLTLTPQGNFGKGRYLMRVAAPELRANL